MSSTHSAWTHVFNLMDIASKRPLSAECVFVHSLSAGSGGLGKADMHVRLHPRSVGY
jgi:hypothetical protein